MYLLIDEFNEVTQSNVLCKEDYESVKDGILFVFKFENDKFYELNEKLDWNIVEKLL